MVKFISGDLLRAKELYIAQGVAEGNQEGLGTGLAFKISTKWPEVQIAFKKHARKGKFKGGKIWVNPPEDNQPGFVYLATQPDMYHATMGYLRKSMRNMRKWADENNIESVALPKIGAGLGKLSWDNEVKPLILELLSDSKCKFIVYEDFKNEYEK